MPSVPKRFRKNVNTAKRSRSSRGNPYSGQYLQQRRFTGSIASCHGKNLTGRNRKSDVGKDPATASGKAYILHLKHAEYFIKKTSCMLHSVMILYAPFSPH
jgi:hypothetical protein